MFDIVLQTTKAISSQVHKAQLLVHLSSWQNGIIGRYNGKSGEARSIACLTRPNFGEAHASVVLPPMTVARKYKIVIVAVYRQSICVPLILRFHNWLRMVNTLLEC